MKTGVCGVAALLAVMAVVTRPTAVAAPLWTMPKLIGMDL